MDKLTIQKLVEAQKQYFYTGKTYDVGFRKLQLLALKDAIKNNMNLLNDALYKDLGKSNYESFMCEISLVLEEINYFLKNLSSLARPKRVSASLAQFPAKCRVYRDPYGVVLIMSPWNYPVQLTLCPLVGAIAGGNCAVIKTSEYSPNVSEVLEKIISDTFAKNYVTVIKGGREENTALLECKFDYIFFTGSVAVGKVVMTAAAKNLTPVTLELGGKSPCIVDSTADLELAAKRICWGKFINSGQTCVAPDYVLVHKSVSGLLKKHLVDRISESYRDALNSDNYPHIITERHFDRLVGLMEGVSAFCGGGYDRKTLKIEPTVLEDVNVDSKVMQEEIFGPLLPVLEYDDINDVVDFIRQRSKPLALYLFSRDKQTIGYITRNVQFGGGCVNDSVIHLATTHMPFGGVGDSGMGGYHGKDSFNTFTRQKSVLIKGRRFDNSLRYPPFTQSKFNTLKKFFK